MNVPDLHAIIEYKMPATEDDEAPELVHGSLVYLARPSAWLRLFLGLCQQENRFRNWKMICTNPYGRLLLLGLKQLIGKCRFFVINEL